MNITKQRLIEIIKEEVLAEGHDDARMISPEEMEEARKLHAKLEAIDNMLAVIDPQVAISALKGAGAKVGDKLMYVLRSLSSEGRTAKLDESGGVAGNFGGAAMELGAQRASGNDMPDHDLYGPQQTAEDNFVGILIDIGRMLDIWEQKEYPSDEARYMSYFEDLQGLLEQYDPCAHVGQKCEDNHPNQSHEECIEVTINNALYEKKDDRVSKKIAHLKSTEDIPQKQAVAMAINMDKEGRLTKDGKYKKKKRG